MLLRNLKFFLFLMSVCLGVFCSGTVLHADTQNSSASPEVKKVFSNTGLPLPRFVSLTNENTNVRAGPGKKYPIKWVINRKLLPVEIILEFDNWRKIRDHEGQEGWVFHSLLSGKRTALVRGENPVFAFEEPFDSEGKKTRISIYLEPFVIVILEDCGGSWCKVSASGFSGWVKRKSLWGVYERENID